MGKERDYIVHDENNIKGFFGEYRWLSNYHLSPIEYDGLIYPSSEHVYQALKTDNIDIRKHIISLPCPIVQKFGQTIDKIDKWDDMKYSFMKIIIHFKFLRNYQLREKLFLTGDKYLEETNHWGDTYWGICNGIGENNLGKILMKIREELKTQ